MCQSKRGGRGSPFTRRFRQRMTSPRSSLMAPPPPCQLQRTADETMLRWLREKSWGKDLRTCRRPGNVLVIRNTEHTARPSGPSVAGDTPAFQAGEEGSIPSVRTGHRLVSTAMKAARGASLDMGSTPTCSTEGDPARDRKSRNGEGRKLGEWQAHCSSPLSRLYRSVVDRLLVTEVAGVRFPVRPQ